MSGSVSNESKSALFTFPPSTMEHELDELPGKISIENRPHDSPSNIKFQIQTNGIDEFLTLLKYQGLMMDQQWNGWKKLWTLCFGICTFALIIAMMSGGIFGLSKGRNAQSQETFLITFCTLLSDVRRLLTMLALIMDAKKIHRMNRMLKEIIEFGFYYSPGISAPIHERSRRQSYWLLKIYHLYFGAISMSWTLMPVWNVYRVHPDVDYEKIDLLYPHSYIGMDKKTHFWWIWFIQVLSLAPGILLYSLSYGLLASAAALLKGQLSILVKSMRLATGSSRHFLLRNDDQPTCSRFGQQTANGIDFRKCIRHHQMILRAVKELKVLMGPQIFINVHFSFAFFILVGAAGTWTDSVYGRLVYWSLTFNWITQICYWTWHLSSLKAAVLIIAWDVLSVARKKIK